MSRHKQCNPIIILWEKRYTEQLKSATSNWLCWKRSHITRLASRLYNSLPDHRTCSFVCHLNYTECLQSWSHFGTLNLSYTLPSLSYQVLIYASAKWNIKGKVSCQRDTNIETMSQRCEEREKHSITFFWKPASSGYWTSMTGSGNCKAIRSNHCATSLSKWIYNKHHRSWVLPYQC